MAMMGSVGHADQKTFLDVIYAKKKKKNGIQKVGFAPATGL